MLDALATGVASLPEQDDAQPPLGRLLVERGFLTDGQLQYALAEHSRTGLPLGQVLISLSYVTATTIAQALATQHGSMLKTEYGFATGFDGEVKAGPASVPPVSPLPAAVLPTWIQADVVPEPAQQPVAAPIPPPFSGPEVAEASTRIASLELELAGARQETLLAQQDAELARQEMLATSAAGEELTAARMRIHELEGETTLTRSALDEATRKADALEQAVVAARGAEAELAAAAERIQALEQAAAGAYSVEAELTAAAERIQALEAELLQTHGQLASTTENLRAAYERLHQFEIAQALHQHQPARTASPFAWQS